MSGMDLIYSIHRIKDHKDFTVFHEWLNETYRNAVEVVLSCSEDQLSKRRGEAKSLKMILDVIDSTESQIKTHQSILDQGETP